MSDPELRQLLVTLFNDADTEYIRSLQAAIEALPGIDQLEHLPRFINTEVNRETAGHLANAKLIPTLLFLDPWGYNGVSLALLQAVLRHWGCDCILFFNYKRINAALDNPILEPNMVELWGREGLDSLRGRLEEAETHEREGIVTDHYRRVLREHGMPQVVSFAFHDEAGTRVSHHLFLVSKHPRARELMTDIMAPYSSKRPQDVPTLRYNPKDRLSPVLIEMSHPLDELMDALCERFAGRRLTVDEAYNEYAEEDPITRASCKEALRTLENSMRVTIDPPANRRRDTTLADWATVTFPSKESPDG